MSEAVQEQLAWAVENVPEGHELRAIVDRIAAGGREGADLAILDALWEGWQIATGQLVETP